jgi:hypothetical protein
MFKRNGMNALFILVFLLGVMVFTQDKPGNSDRYKQLSGILAFLLGPIFHFSRGRFPGAQVNFPNL